MSSRPADESGAPAADQTAKTPPELERDISETRQRLGDTVDAISQKADVKAQLKDAAEEQKAKLSAKREQVGQRLSGGGAKGDAAQQARRLANELAERTSRQPLPYLCGALVLGVIAGRMRTRRGRDR